MADTAGVIRVLHVDDEPDFVEMAADLLEREGEAFHVETALDAEEGLAKLEAGAFDCVVSDYNMPGDDGLAFLRRVRAAYGDLPFILYTGKGSEEVAGEAISAGVTDYLQKTGGTSQYGILANRIENAVERRRARATAERTEEQFGLLAEHIDDILWMYTADWEELLFINSAYEEIWGRSIDELREYPPAFQRGVHPADRPITRAAMDRLSDGEPVDIEFRVNAEEDFGRWVWVKGRPVVDESGTVTRVTGFARDVTERRSRRAELERQRDRMEFALEATDSYVFEVDLETGAETRFGDWATLHDLDPGAVPTTEAFIEHAVHPDDRGAVEAALESFDPVPGTSVTFDYRTPPDRGPVRWIRSVLGVRSMEDSDAPRALGLATDVTDLQRERERLEALFENSIDAIVLCEFQDGVPVIRDVNASFEETFGYPADELVGEPLDRFVVPEAEREAARSLNRRIERGERVLEEVRRVTETGVRDFLLQSTPLHSGEDGPWAYTIYSDITDRKARERQLQAERDRHEAFARVLSHDLRNPLNVAAGRLELAAEACESEHLDAVAAAHDSIRSLIDDVLALARAGEGVESVQPVDLAAAVEAAWANIESNDADVVVEAEGTILADEAQLGRLLENLLRNAVEHGGDGVTVEVGDLPDGFYVEDDGPGIPAAERSAVFEAGHTTNADGTGFGLSIVRDVATGHGWSVTIATGDAGGARFEVTDVELDR